MNLFIQIRKIISERFQETSDSQLWASDAEKDSVACQVKLSRYLRIVIPARNQVSIPVEWFHTKKPITSSAFYKRAS